MKQGGIKQETGPDGFVKVDNGIVLTIIRKRKYYIIFAFCSYSTQGQNTGTFVIPEVDFWNGTEFALPQGIVVSSKVDTISSGLSLWYSSCSSIPVRAVWPVTESGQ